MDWHITDKGKHLNYNFLVCLTKEDEGAEEDLKEDDLYTKAEKEFYSIIEQEKKLLERKQQQTTDMDKGDTGKVCWMILR